MIPVDRSMKGSGAPGKRRRAASRSPPCNSGSSVSPWGKMSVALAAFAMLTEMFDGYPPWLLRAIGHPVIWMGFVIAMLDRLLNRETAGPKLRWASGIVALLLLLAIVGPVCLRRPARAVPPSILRLHPDGLHRWHLDRAMQPAPARAQCRGRPGEQRACRRPHGGIAHCRPRHAGARQSRRRPCGDRKPRREFFRRHRCAGAVARHRRASRSGTLQGNQHRRQHDRPPYRASREHSAGRRRNSTIWSTCRHRGWRRCCSSRRQRCARTHRRSMHGASVWLDAPRHRSPNAGYPEAAMAGALGLSLAGPRIYGGVRSRRCHDGQRPLRMPTPPTSAARLRFIAPPTRS